MSASPLEEIQTAIQKLLSNPKKTGEDAVKKVIFVDVSHSVMHPQLGQFFHDDYNIPRGRKFCICDRIVSDVDKHSQVGAAGLTTNTNTPQAELLAFLSLMNEKHQFFVVSIGNRHTDAFTAESSNPGNTVRSWYDRVLSGDPAHYLKGNGTSIVHAIEAFLFSDYAKGLSSTDRIRISVKCDGLAAQDTSTTMRRAFTKLFERFPNTLVDIDAFVLQVKPTKEISSSTAGIDIYDMLPRENLSSFRVHWMVVEETPSVFKPATEPIISELAVGNIDGARLMLCEIEVVIPSSVTERANLSRGLFRVLFDHSNYLATVQPQQMGEMLQNLGALAGVSVDEGDMRCMMSQLMRTWLMKHVSPESITDDIIEGQLNTLVYAAKTAAMLNGRTLRGQQQRAANFEAILDHWKRGNPVINLQMLGAPAVMVDAWDVTKMATITLTKEVLSKFNNRTLLYMNKFIILPTLACPGMTNDDYARMAIRRIFSTVLQGQGAGSSQSLSKRIEMVALVVRLAVMARVHDPHSETTRIMIGITRKMLDKEQKKRTGQIAPSALACMESDAPIPSEHARCSLFGKDPAKTLLFASGISNEAPTMELPVPYITDLQKKFDVHTYESIPLGEYYRHETGDLYTKESMEYCVGNRLRSRNGTPYERTDFTAMNSATELKTWMDASVGDSPLSLADLMGVHGEPQHPVRPPTQLVQGHPDQPIGIVVLGGLSSGKSFAIGEAVKYLTKRGIEVANTLQRMDDQLPKDARVYEHHPDTASYRDGSFNGRMAGQATKGDKRFINTNPGICIVFVNTNAKDGEYIGAKETLLMQGSLPHDYQAFTENDWKDYISFTVYNGVRRTWGFRPVGDLRDKWFDKAQKVSTKFLPSHYQRLWGTVKKQTPMQIREGWQRHVDKGNDLSSVRERVHEFVEKEVLPRLMI